MRKNKSWVHLHFVDFSFRRVSSPPSTLEVATSFSVIAKLMTEKTFSRSNPLTLSYKDQQKFWKQQEERDKEKAKDSGKTKTHSNQTRTKVEALHLESTANIASMTEVLYFA